MATRDRGGIQWNFRSGVPAGREEETSVLDIELVLIAIVGSVDDDQLRHGTSFTSAGCARMPEITISRRVAVNGFVGDWVRSTRTPFVQSVPGSLIVSR